VAYSAFVGSPGVHLVEADPAPRVDELVARLARRRILAEFGDTDVARRRARDRVTSLLPETRLLDVVADGVVVGYVWVRRDGDLLALLDADADPQLDGGLGPPLREALLGLARAEGAKRLDTGVAPDQDGLRRAVVAGGEFILMSTNMRLDLALPPDRPDGPRVSLDPMSGVEFDDFMRESERAYVAERAASGEPPEWAARVAREQLATLLPEGRHSRDQHFFTARLDQESFGQLWLATDSPTAFVYDVVVGERMRGRGLGRALMVAAERWAHQRGAIGVGLHVFAHNAVARRLYDSLGYAVLEEFWQRPVDL
jgi:ribosomal protein S18 acetylase RimI-like enzyme